MAAAAPADPDIPLGVIGELIGYHLRRVSAVVAADFTAAVGDRGMRQALFGILSVVEANPGINQGNVGRVLGIQRANMVSLVNELTDRGLITRVTAATDRRAFALVLTEAGRSLFKACSTSLRAHEERLFEGLSAAERRMLRDLLGRLEDGER